jgi:hypothetical protein
MRSTCVGRWAGLFAFLLVAHPSLAAADQSGPQVRVIGPIANVRDQATDAAAVVFQAKSGDALRLVQNQGDWILIETAAGKRGYVFHTLVEILPTAAAAAPAEGGPGIDHTPIECIVAEQYPKLDAGFQPPDVARARVYFKAASSIHWYWVAMTVEAGRFIGILPKPKKETHQIDYYVEGLDKASQEGRTKDYAPAVVPSKEDCRKKAMAPTVSSAQVVVGGEAGAAAVPAGFEAAGLAVAAVAAGAGAGAAAGGHAALFIAGGVAVAGGTTAIIATHHSGPPPCTPNGFTFTINYGFTGTFACSKTNGTQQSYTVTNNTCSRLTVQSLGVSYAFQGLCTGSVPRTENLILNGATTIAPGTTAVIRTGAPVGQARTFCCPNPPCAPATCTVNESFALNTSAGTQTLTNTFTVNESGTDCPGCALPHADANEPPMCFVGEHP